MPERPNGSPPLALTFDDVLLRPGLSEVMPSDVDIRTRVTREIPLNIPIIASAMDTVTEVNMAIAMAQAGGIGVIHRNLEPDLQAEQVRRVKRFESGMVVNPLTIGPAAKPAKPAPPSSTSSAVTGIILAQGFPCMSTNMAKKNSTPSDSARARSSASTSGICTLRSIRCGQ